MSTDASQLTNNDITIAEAISNIELTTNVGLVPFLEGSPGIGKSSGVNTVADNTNKKVITMFLSQMSPEDLLGFPMINKETGRTDFVPPSILPLAGLDEVPEGKEGWCLFLDEINAAPLAVQAAAYSLVLDRKVGKHQLHPAVSIVAAGNRLTDGAMVHPMSSALSSRMVKYTVKENLADWLNWSVKQTTPINHKIRSYLDMVPGNFYTFQKQKDATGSFASPRTWHMLSKVLDSLPDDTMQIAQLPTYAGLVGSGVAREFINFLQIFIEFPKISELINNPDAFKIPDEANKRYAIAGLLGDSLNDSNSKPLMSIIDRLPKEFQVISMRLIIKGDTSLMNNADVSDWVLRNNTEFND